MGGGFYFSEPFTRGTETINLIDYSLCCLSYTVVDAHSHAFPSLLTKVRVDEHFVFISGVANMFDAGYRICFGLTGVEMSRICRQGVLCNFAVGWQLMY